MVPNEPTTVEIYGDSRQRGFCRGCRNDIVWATIAASGKRVAFSDPLPTLDAFERDRRVIERVNTADMHPCKSDDTKRKRLYGIAQ